MNRKIFSKDSLKGHGFPVSIQEMPQLLKPIQKRLEIYYMISNFSNYILQKFFENYIWTPCNAK